MGYFVRFFCPSKRTEERISVTSSTKLNEPKKRRPEPSEKHGLQIRASYSWCYISRARRSQMKSSACFYARYTKPGWRYETGRTSRHFRFALAPWIWILDILREFWASNRIGTKRSSPTSLNLADRILITRSTQTGSIKDAIPQR